VLCARDWSVLILILLQDSMELNHNFLAIHSLPFSYTHSRLHGSTCISCRRGSCKEIVGRHHIDGFPFSVGDRKDDVNYRVFLQAQLFEGSIRRALRVDYTRILRANQSQVGSLPITRRMMLMISGGNLFLQISQRVVGRTQQAIGLIASLDAEVTVIVCL
jgi:hypothetical protein